MLFAGLYALAPSFLDALKIVKPETVIRWHRTGFRAYWRWKSRSPSGRPKTPAEIRQLIGWHDDDLARGERDAGLADPHLGLAFEHAQNFLDRV
jgi:hypothetical protein